MSSEYLTLHCAESDSDAINKVTSILEELSKNETDAVIEYQKGGECVSVKLDGRVLNFYSSKRPENETLFTLEVSLDNEEEVFEAILNLFVSLEISVISCEAYYSGVGEASKLKYIDGEIQWIDKKDLSPENTKVYMSGTFSNEYDAPEKALNDRGGILVLDPRSAQLLVIGDDYDRSVRRYFLEHDLPVVDEKDFYQLFLEEQLLV